MQGNPTAKESPVSAAPQPIVLIHGFWVTPRSWEDWAAHYEKRGFRVLTPAYPGFEVEVEALNADPAPVEEVTIPAIVAHLESVVRGLDAPPIVIGHSAGGVFTQLLLDKGLGAAGVALNSAPTEGVPVVPVTQVKSTFPVLRNPANRHKAIRYSWGVVPISRVKLRRSVSAEPSPDRRAITSSGASEVSSRTRAASTRTSST